MVTSPLDEAVTIDAPATALVLIDLQRGIVAAPTVPHPASDVVARANQLARATRNAGGLVVHVRVSLGLDGALAVQPPSDVAPPTTSLPPGWDEFAHDLERTDKDVAVIKYQWGAFHGTDLDTQLRRRKISTIVLGGISTHVGVESTARAAHEHGYELIVVHDATADHDGDAHEHSINRVFPKIGRVRSTRAILTAIGMDLTIRNPNSDAGNRRPLTTAEGKR